MVRLPGGRAQPAVVVEMWRDPLGLQVNSASTLIPVETIRQVDRHLERPSEYSILDQLLDRAHSRAEAVELAPEPEPGVEPEDGSVTAEIGRASCREGVAATAGVAPGTD